MAFRYNARVQSPSYIPPLERPLVSINTVLAQWVHAMLVSGKFHRTRAAMGS